MPTTSSPQAPFTTKSRIVLPGLGGQIAEAFTGLVALATSGYTYDMSRCRSFCITQSQDTSSTGSWGGTMQVEQKLAEDWIPLGSSITVGSTDTYFATPEYGYGKIRLNPSGLTVSTIDTTLTFTITGFRAAPGY